MMRYDIEIEIEGPIMTAGLSAASFGVDVAFLRDHRGRLVVPGSMIQGVVREVLEDMSAAAPSLLPAGKLDAWLGAPSVDAREDADTVVSAGFEPHRGCLDFSDFELSDPAPLESITRIQVDAETGSVERGMLAVLEAPVAPGARGTLRGVMTVDADQATAEQAREWAGKALRLLPAIGGVKGAGFGHIEAVRIEPQREPPRPTTGPLAAAAREAGALAGRDRVQMALEFEAPFLVSSEAISGNLFKGSHVIPGGAIKGALAERLEQSGSSTSLADTLDRTVFRHARPAKADDLTRRPRTIPLSLYSLEHLDDGNLEFDGLHDALADDPDGWAADGWFVQFGGNWKDGGKAEKEAQRLYGQHFIPRYDIRTRTAIGARGEAETSKLFTSMAVVPADFVWIGEIRLRSDTDRASFSEVVAALDKVILKIGKMRTPARVALLDLPDGEPQVTPLATNADRVTWRLVLETDALLHGPDDVFRHADVADGSERLKRQYRDYFAAAVNERLEKDAEPVEAEDVGLRFFARQRWAGGYQARRFPTYPDCYYPHLVTEAGSVFEVVLPQRCTGAIKAFASHGLPLPASVPSQGYQYQRSPFVPENGYGEVSIEDRALTDSPFGRAP